MGAAWDGGGIGKTLAFFFVFTNSVTRCYMIVFYNLWVVLLFNTLLRFGVRPPFGEVLRATLGGWKGFWGG